VNSHNEWDPLEEVIIGKTEGATLPYKHIANYSVIPDKIKDEL